MLRNIFIRLMGLISLMKWLVSTYTDLNADAIAFGETRRKWRKRGTEVFGDSGHERKEMPFDDALTITTGLFAIIPIMF